MDRQQAHHLLDRLGPAQFTAIVQLLEALTSAEGVNPLDRAHAQASVEEEEITPETAQALDCSRASLARGEGIPHAAILREFGLSQQRFRKVGRRQ